MCPDCPDFKTWQEGRISNVLQQAVASESDFSSKVKAPGWPEGLSSVEKTSPKDTVGSKQLQGWDGLWGFSRQRKQLNPSHPHCQ